MSDTTTPQNDIIAQYLAQLAPRQQSYAPPAPVDRSVASLLGEAVGGGTTGLAPADRESAGTRALLNFGLNMLSASGPSTMPRSFGQVFAQGAGGAEQSLAGSEAVGASRLAAQQAYEEKQQELTIAKIREAIPLLTLQTQMQQAAAARGLAGNQPAPAPGTSISGVGAPVVPRDPNAGTAGQQANNPGNIMMTPSAVPTGASGAVPVSGGRYVAAFPDVPTGVAAHSDLLTNYARSGVGTIRDAMTRWVGDPKADLTSYVADVAKAAGVGPDDKVDLSDPKIQRAILLAQQPHESGKAWLSPADVDKGLALAAARRAAPPAATGGTQAPAPYKVASTGPTAPPAPTATSAATPAPGSVAAETAGLNVPPGATPPAAPGAQPAAPAATTAPAPTTTTAPATPTAPSENPDIVSGDVVVRHPGPFADFAARERLPLPTTEDFNPNLTPAQQAAFDARAKGVAARAQDLALKRDQITQTFPFAEQPKALADLSAQSAALAAEQQTLAADKQTAAQAKAQAAAAAATKFNDTQNEAVQKRYDAALAHYNDVAKTKITASQDIVKSQATDQIAQNKAMMEPYQTSATQAAGLLPTIALARQILPGLPTNAAPWLNDEQNRGTLEALKPIMPKTWSDAIDNASLYKQVMSNVVGQMAGNVVSGQTGGRESAYQQFQAEYPGLANTAEGRERGLLYAQELLQRRMQLAEAMQKYQAKAPRDPVTGIPDMSGARAAVENSVPMLQLPPTSYRPDLAPTNPAAAANRARYNDYYNSIRDGGRYVGYRQDEKGEFHPVALTKAAGKGPAAGVE